MASEPASTPAPADLSRLRIRREEEPAPRRGRAVPILIAAVLGIAVLGLFGWRFLAPGMRPIEVAAGVVLGPDVAGGEGSILTASGYIVARRKAGVGPKVPGLLEWLGVEEGSKVAAGQVIGRLQSHDVAAQLLASRSELEERRADLVEAEAVLDQYRKEFERTRSLRDQGVVSSAEFDVAEARRRSQEARVHSQQSAITTAQARVRWAEVAVADTEIRAPFSGTVLTKDAEEGESVAPAAAGRVSSRGSLVTMADLASLEVEVDVNESYIARLAHGQPARIVADSFPETVYQGEIRQIIPTADRQKATVQVKVRIIDPGDLLRPDMGAKVTFVEGPARGGAGSARAAGEAGAGADASRSAGAAGAAGLPGSAAGASSASGASGAAAGSSPAAGAAPRAAAIHPLPRVPARALAAAEGGGRRVWVIDGETVHPVRVETARETDGYVEVRSGLTGGERVVLDPPPGLAEGKKVRVRA